jgi:protein involved in polysaccharide export with SLBB domain
MSARARASLALAALLAAAVVLGGACGDPTPSKYPTQPFYVEDATLGADDQLEITVYLGGGSTKIEDISKVYPVSADGALSFPMIGTVEASGRTAQDVEAEIRDRLADGYIVSPNVTVQVKEYRSKKISIFGEVRKPGTLSWRPSMSISEAISEAAGFTAMARPNAAVVTRRIAEGQTEKYTVPVEKIANNSAPPFYMRPGDSIYIPKRLF